MTTAKRRPGLAVDCDLHRLYLSFCGVTSRDGGMGR
jgi:hypothetical protein